MGPRRSRTTGHSAKPGLKASEKTPYKNIVIENNQTECSVVALFKKWIVNARAWLVRQNTEQFINILFWHSIVMTINTPLARLTRGRWSSVNVFYWGSIVLFWLRIDNEGNKDSEEPGFDEGLVYKTEMKEKGIDFAFGFHAIAGLLWLLAGWIQMSSLKTSKAWHRTFGVFAIFTFILHMMASMNNLYFNSMKHSPLPRLHLFMIVIDSIVCMIIAMIRARKKDYAGHRDAMVRCFVYSIEGAGTIRTVAHFQAFAGMHVTDCQILWNGTSTNCLYGYMWRLIFTRFLSMFYLGLYTVHRNNYNFTKAFFMELVCLSLISVCFIPQRSMVTVDLMFQLYPELTVPFFVLVTVFARAFILRKSSLH